MKTLPYKKSLADAVIHGIAEHCFTPRAACGENNIAYGDLLSWLEADEALAYRFEAALARRIYILEQEYLTCGDPQKQKTYIQLLEVANPEGFSIAKGERSPIKQKKAATAPFPRAWQDTPNDANELSAAPQALPGPIPAPSPRVVRLKTSGE